MSILSQRGSPETLDAIVYAVALTRDMPGEIVHIAGAAFFVAVVVTFGCVFGGGQ